MAEDNSFERNLCIIKKVFAFKIPPNTSGSGHKASDWPSQPIWTGRLRVVAKNKRAFIKLEHLDKDGLFAMTEVTSMRVVEPVADSSRYFVLRVEDGRGNHAFLGLGFNSRDEAFDFKVSLQDFENEKNGAKRAQEAMAELGPSQDFSLPEGTTIKVELKTKKTKKKSEIKTSSDTDASGRFSLAPPPKKGDKPAVKKPEETKANTATTSSPAANANLFDFANEFSTLNVQDKPVANNSAAAASDLFDPFGSAPASNSQAAKPTANNNSSGDWVDF